MIANPPAPATPASKPIREISHSSVNQIANCARKYQIRKTMRHVERIFDDSMAACSGRAIHIYLQDMMEGKSEQEALLDMFWEYDFSLEETASPQDKEHRSIESAIFAARRTIEVVPWLFQPDRLAKIIPINEDTPRPAIEAKFNIIFTNDQWACDYHYRGLIDFISYDSALETFTVGDIKTHRSFARDIAYRYKFSPQLIPYGLVIALLTSEDRGEIVNTLSTLKFQTAYLSIFLDALEPNIEHLTYDKTQEDVMDWIQAIFLLCQQLESYHTLDVWPRSVSGCEAWNRPCAFFNKCHIANKEDLQSTLIFPHEVSELPPPEPFGEWMSLTVDTTRGVIL